MLRFFLSIVIILCVSVRIAAQDTIPAPTNRIADTILNADSNSISIDSATLISFDSVSKRPIIRDSLWQSNGDVPLQEQILQRHPFFNFNTRPVVTPPDIKRFNGKELLFYVLVALVIIFALLKLAFSKYFNDLFRVFFRTTMKQRQIKEQLMQTPFPSLVFNGFFVASAGLYANFLLHYFGFKPVDNFWLLYLYCCIGLSIIYLVKFIGLIVCGWLFNMKKAAESYIFIVFIINKVIGIALLPFNFLLAFTDGAMHSIALMLSWCCIAGLFLYRFILGFAAIRNEVKFNLFHFFLYLCAFEIAPLLLIYKLLLFFL
ncbi:DUF4271 domain-containing protein [Terrimonas alba]|uniref:DUF4271 domain-containing protein n=1 Tax=Terrimonas alba TaxID=3349636 RepID=UPI0035F48F1D